MKISELGPEPVNTAKRLAWLSRVELCEDLSPETRARIHGLKEVVQRRLAGQHECKCCGILLVATAGPVGPECAKHPEDFPCNAHRGRR